MRLRLHFMPHVHSASLLLVMLIAAVFNSIALAQSEQPPNLDEPTGSPLAVAEVEAFFDDFISLHLESDHIAGAVVSVVQSGELLFSKGYGFANVERQTPMDAERTLVHIGSSGKTFTVIAALQLVEQGLLELDADVNTYLDFDIPATYPQPITIRHLLTHTSGFEGRDLHILTENPDALVPVRDYLTRNIPARVRPPGIEIGYSNYGIALLGYIVERVSGVSFSQYLQDNILTPLSMSRTSSELFLPDELIADFATGYVYNGRNYQPQSIEYIQAFGAGPIRSTAADMAHFMIANLQHGEFNGERMLSEDTAVAMLSTQFTADPRLNGIGFGFYEMSRNGQRIMGHIGTSSYFHTLMALLPEQALGVFVSFNSAEAVQPVPQGVVLNAFLDRFFPVMPETLEPSSDFAARAGDYTGLYFWNNRHGITNIEKTLFPGDAVTITTANDNTLLVTLFGLPRRFIEVEHDVFSRVDVPDTLIFHRGENGQVTSASLNSRPVFTLERRPWYEAPMISLGVIVAASLIFISVPLTAIVARLGVGRRSGETKTQTSDRLSYWVLVLLALVNVVTVAVILALILRGATLVSDSLLRAILGLPVAALVLTALSAVMSLRLWWRGTWSVAVRLHYSLAVLASIALLTVFNLWNILGWRL